VRQFYLETDPDHLPQPGETVTLDEDESHHLFTVLRGGRKPELELVDGRGHRLTGVSRGRDGSRARVDILTSETDGEEFRQPRLVLACAVVKGRRFEWALEKAVELGAHEFLPLETEFGVVDPRPGKLGRWQSLMLAALKQSGRSWLPVLARPLSVREVLARHPLEPKLFGAAPDDVTAPVRPVAIRSALMADEDGDPPATLTMLIGPEGGWSPHELKVMSGSGARPVSLGPHVQRTETAVVTGLTVLQALREQWSTG
jgi:16S rRNA (uracil1498-N3)-methyltransferase